MQAPFPLVVVSATVVGAAVVGAAVVGDVAAAVVCGDVFAVGAAVVDVDVFDVTMVDVVDVPAAFGVPLEQAGTATRQAAVTARRNGRRDRGRVSGDDPFVDCMSASRGGSSK